MKVDLKELEGEWEAGWALDKHTLKSTYIGDDSSGRAQFETVRSEAGEALFQLKYRHQKARAELLARAINKHILPRLPTIQAIAMMPASGARAIQPVVEIASSLSGISKIPVLAAVLQRASGGKPLKDLSTREEKLEALDGRLSLNRQCTIGARTNILLLDDIIHTGASLSVAVEALRRSPHIIGVYVATATWR
jgi:predicted amidophosphoribosyltransferase